MFIELIENEISELDKKTIKQGRYFVLEEKMMVYTPNKHYEVKMRRKFSSDIMREIDDIDDQMQICLSFSDSISSRDAYFESIENKRKEVERIKLGDNLLTCNDVSIKIQDLTNKTAVIVGMEEEISESYLFIKSCGNTLKADKLSDKNAKKHIKEKIIDTISKIENLNPIFSF